MSRMKACNQAVTLTFQDLAPSHLPLLHGWLQQPHVREFWDDGDRTLQQVQAHYFGPARDAVGFMVTLGTEAVAYAQAYPVPEASDYAKWRSSTGETWGIDLFIGEERWLGHGLAVDLIKALLMHLRRQQPELQRVLIDPEARNTRARHIYAKAGFVVVGEQRLLGKRMEIMALDL
ncbi:acetyltransferase [Deinococcus piscis]|uniref:Acetyltransferase n=2 Tax=Deinococcus piscis TaxID=394230 RepID=A0ABQ3KFI1_9DEIO|nr:acetyltransferase [Deinococcus piscis]